MNGFRDSVRVFYIAEIIGLYETVFIIVQKHNVIGDEDKCKGW